jgi:type IV pilus assembly protein PilB
VEAALTGHLVFSTLHTNNAAGVIPRLIDLDVNPKILVSALSLSIAQRLVRRLCVHCKKEREITTEEMALINSMIEKMKSYGKDILQYGIDTANPFKFYAPVGCLECNNTGYKGQIGIFEAIYNNAEIENIIVTNPSEREIKEIAKKQVSLSIQQDGLVKILKGITSYEEVASTVDFYEE